MVERLRVAINAQFSPAEGFGGVESVLIGLLSALGKLNDNGDEYLVITSSHASDWLEPYLGENQRVISAPASLRKTNAKGPFRRHVMQPVLRAVRRRLGVASVWPDLPISTGFYESLGCDVIHFPYQDFTLCSIPTVYNPHDLQHRHFPQFFSPRALAHREVIYRGGCLLAQTVVAGSAWVKQDIMQQYGIAPERIQVIPWAPPTQAYSDVSQDMIASVRGKYLLPEQYIFFPAVTWPHKNHLRLLDAIALLRQQHDLVVNLVCTGSKHPGYWPTVENHVVNLKLEDHVQFVGRVPESDLRSIYRLAQGVIVPTLFEAASGPVFEAWEEGVPVACAAVTSLPEQVGDAALIFDPYSPASIASAIRQLTIDSEKRAELVARGFSRLNDFSWERTARAYRAVYRRTALKSLTDEDQRLLAWDWMREPNHSLEDRHS